MSCVEIELRTAIGACTSPSVDAVAYWTVLRSHDVTPLMPASAAHCTMPTRSPGAKPLPNAVIGWPSASSSRGVTSTGSFCDCLPSIGEAGIASSTRSTGDGVDVELGSVVVGAVASSASSRPSSTNPPSTAPLSRTTRATNSQRGRGAPDASTSSSATASTSSGVNDAMSLPPEPHVTSRRKRSTGGTDACHGGGAGQTAAGLGTPGAARWGSTMQLELLATGYGLVEGPRTDAEDNLYFTDIPGGSVYCRHPDGTIDTLVTGRPMVGGLALHVDGGFVMSGPTVAHWRDGEVRVLLEVDGVNAFNDIQPDADGRVYAGAIRSDLTDLRAEKVPAECYRIGPAARSRSSTAASRCPTASASRPTAPRCTTSTRRPRASGPTTWPPMAPCPTAATSAAPRSSAASRTACASTPTATCGLPTSVAGGSSSSPHRRPLDEIPVPAKAVTSVAFGGPDADDMYIVTADNLDEPDRRGCVFRCRPGVTGLVTPLAAI